MSETTTEQVEQVETQPTEQQQAEAETRTFTQEEIDRIIADRLKRQKDQFKDYDELKHAAARLAELEESQKSETEKAISEAEKRTRQVTLGEVGQRLAAAEIKAALTGVVIDPAGIVEDLNLSRYVNSDGEVDTEAVQALRAKYEALIPKPDGRPKGSADQGARGDGAVTYSRAQLRDPKFYQEHQEDILRAAREGRITD